MQFEIKCWPYVSYSAPYLHVNTWGRIFKLFIQFGRGNPDSEHPHKGRFWLRFYSCGHAWDNYSGKFKHSYHKLQWRRPKLSTEVN